MPMLLIVHTHRLYFTRLEKAHWFRLQLETAIVLAVHLNCYQRTRIIYLFNTLR